MNCSENEFVCSVKKENNLGYYRLHSIWRKDGFFLNVTSKEGAWRGEMASDDVINFSRQLNMEPNIYLDQCKTALTSPNGLPDMTYSVESGSFTWKKIDDQDSGIKIRMGSVLLEPASFVDTIQNLVTAALNCNEKLQEKILQLEKDNEVHLKNKQDLMNKLDELIKTKNEMENDLYGRFILLLNSKKKKIKELQNILNDKNKSIESTTNVSNSQTSFNVYEMDTDNDSDETNLSPPQSKKIAKESKGFKTENKTLKKNSSLHEKGLKQEIKSVEEMSVDDVPSSSQNTQPFNKFNSSTDIISKKKTEIPSTKDELLDFFYGES